MRAQNLKTYKALSPADSPRHPHRNKVVYRLPSPERVMAVLMAGSILVGLVSTMSQWYRHVTPPIAPSP